MILELGLEVNIPFYLPKRDVPFLFLRAAISGECKPCHESKSLLVGAKGLSQEE